MAFRRMRRRRFRRSPYDLRTIVECRHAVSIPAGSQCPSPAIDSILIAGNEEDAIAGGLHQGATKGFTFGGCHFQVEHGQLNLVNSSFTNVATSIDIFEAIVVLPYANGTFGVPAYLPQLTNQGFTGGDRADRVLWKRITQMWFISTDIVSVQVDDTYDESGHGPQQCKTKATLDERTGVFYVGAYTNGLIDGAPMVLERNSWWKVAVKERRR